MKVNTNKKNVFKRVINIILGVLMGIVGGFSVGVFTLACIGSCSSKTATVKADNSDVGLYSTISNNSGYWYFGNEVLPAVNFYYRPEFQEGITSLYPGSLAPNGSVNEFYDCGFDIALLNRKISDLSNPPSYVDKLPADTIPFLLIRGGFKFYIEPFNFFTQGGTSNREYCSVFPLVIDNETINFQALPVGPDATAGSNNPNYNKFCSLGAYGFCDNPSFANGYSCIYFRGDYAFDSLSVRQVRYSSKFVDYQNRDDIFANILTFVDSKGYSVDVEFICQDVFYKSFRTSLFMWESRTYFVDSSITDDDKYQAGFDDGFDEGFGQGLLEGGIVSDETIKNAFERGKNEGYNLGFQAGASDKLTSQNFFNKVFSIFDVKIFGFMSLGDIFKIVFVLAIGIWALRVFAGG